MYEILNETYDYKADDIFVLYADGNPPTDANCNDPEHVNASYPTNIIDYAATAANLQTVCSHIAANGDPGDTLFVLTTDHGRISGGISTLVLWNGTEIRADAFANTTYIGQINQYNWRAFEIEQCYGGGFIPYLSKTRTVIATACTKDEVSHGWVVKPYYDIFSYYFGAALKWEKPDGTAVNADANQDGKVSLMEAFNYAEANDTASETPQYDDNGDGISHTGQMPANCDGYFGSQIFLGESAPIITGDITGETRDVNSNLLSNVEVSLYGLYGGDMSSPDYCIVVNQTGEYWLSGSKYGYFDLLTKDLPPAPRNPYHPDYINLTTPGLLAAGYILDFEGDYGLVPKACTMSYAMKSVNHWLFVPIDGSAVPHPEWQLSGWKAMESVHSWQYPSEGAKTQGITRAAAAIESASTVVRYLPSCLNRGETFNVTVTFTATEDDFNAIGVTDFGPEGWNTTINISHSIPEADNAKCKNNTVEIEWNGPYAQNTTFTAVYQVTVPEDAQPGNYTFGSGFLEHYIAGTGPYIASIGGECKTAVIGVENATLEGLVSFQGRGTPPNDRWIEPFNVTLFEPGNLSNVLWTGVATTNNTGVFTIDNIPAGTYDIGIKNWTCLSELETGVVLSGGEITEVDFGTTREGDANNDDWVTGADRALLYAAWGSHEGDPNWNPHCDFNRDGYVTMADLSLMLPNWNQHGDLV
jgi:hypothetical protein